MSAPSPGPTTAGTNASRGRSSASARQPRASLRAARPKTPEPLAALDPVARVAVDIPLAHLDRLFDYAVPQSMADGARPGARVRVRFAGRLVDGFVVARAADTEHAGTLARLARVTSAEPVLHPAVLAAARQVADRCAGTLADVLRLAVPPRHAATEARATSPALPPPPAPVPGPWTDYGSGPAFLRAVGDGRAPRAVWAALPGPSWPDAVAIAAATALAAGRGALVVVADRRDVDRVGAALIRACGPDQHVELTAELGPAERYRRFLAVSRGQVRCVVGTRAAAFAPVRDLGLAVIWDDGDDLHAEPHAPYPHVRDILRVRADVEDAALLLGGLAVTAEAARLVADGQAHPVVADRATVRRHAPSVRATGDDAELARDPVAATARLPQLAWRTAREALDAGPVLVQVPRRGYASGLACTRCRTPARCSACSGPLEVTSGHAVPHCQWCGRPAGRFECPACGGTRLRAAVIGARRTAEELGRAFPGTPVRTSGRDTVRATVGPEPALVVATPGAEPVAEGGYAAALLLDGWALLERPDLRAGEEALRRWIAAASLVRPAREGGRVVVVAEASRRPVQALVRWDPLTAAERELDDRRELAFPPAAVLAELTGPPLAVADLLDGLVLPPGTTVLGPQPYTPPRRRRAPRVPGAAAVGARRGADSDGPGDGAPETDAVRALVKAPLGQRQALARALAASQAGRSARKAPGSIRVRIDPVDVG